MQVLAQRNIEENKLQQLCRQYRISPNSKLVAYLSGGMEYKKNLGAVWREWIAEQLEPIGIGVVDPVKIEPPQNGVPTQSKLTELKHQGRLDEVRDIARECLFRKDMLGIQLSDFIVVLYDESVQRGAGTLSESWEAFREGRPVYVVTEFPIEKIPTWLIGETTQIFEDFQSLLLYLKDETIVKKDIEKAQRVRMEVLGEIYQEVLSPGRSEPVR